METLVTNNFKNTLVSIIVPNYNYGHLIVETLESVKAQSYSKFECIIVDDGSTDNSVEVITNWIKDDQRFLLLQKTNGGLPSTRNEGMKIAKGEWFAFLDADDIWLPNKISNQLTILDTEKGYVAYGNTQFFRGNKDLGQQIYDSTSIDAYTLLGGNPIIASSIMIHRTVFEKVGFFVNDLRSSEDLDYLFRIALNGYKFSCSTSIDVRMRKHDSSMQMNYLRMYLNKMYCFDRSYDALINSSVKLEKDKLKTAFLVRFQSMLWTARDANRPDLIKYCYIRTRQLVGFQFYFTKLYWQNKKYDWIQSLRNFKNRTK